MIDLDRRQLLREKRNLAFALSLLCVVGVVLNLIGTSWPSTAMLAGFVIFMFSSAMTFAAELHAMNLEPVKPDRRSTVKK